MFPAASAYLKRLERHLNLDERDTTDLLRELEGHVEDRVESLVRQGLSLERANDLALAGLGRPQTLAHLMRQAHLTVRWREALFAAVPSLLVAIVIGGGLWDHPVVSLGFATVIISVTLYGLWLGRPAWFYPWAGVALTFPLFAGYFAYTALESGLSAVRSGDANALALCGVAGALLYFPVGLFIVATAIAVAIQRDWLDASVLLTPLPCALVWVIAIHRAGGFIGTDESIQGTAALLALVYVAVGCVTIMLLRAPNRPLKVGLLVGGAILVLSLASALDPQTTLTLLIVRSCLLVSFLLSPAVAVRRL